MTCLILPVQTLDLRRLRSSWSSTSREQKAETSAQLRVSCNYQLNETLNHVRTTQRMFSAITSIWATGCIWDTPGRNEGIWLVTHHRETWKWLSFQSE